MIWGCMAAYVRGFMSKIEGKMDKYEHKSILENNLSNVILKIMDNFALTLFYITHIILLYYLL